MIAALLVGDATDADACICPSKAFTLPTIGATDVPTNVRELYFPSSYTVGSPVLRSVSGEQVPLTVRATPGYKQQLKTAELQQELQPNTHYELWTDANNEKVLDFTTAAGPDVAAPSAPDFDGFHIDYFKNADNDSSCGTKSFAMEGYVVAPVDEDIVSVTMRFIANDGTSEERILPPYPRGERNPNEMLWRPSVLGPMVCQLDLTIFEGEYRVEAWTIDAAGNKSDVTAQRVIVDGGCSTTRSSSLAMIFVVLGFAMRRRREDHRSAAKLRTT